VQSDKSKLKKIKIILRDFGIRTGKIHNPSYKVDPNYWRMYVSADSQELFVRKIKSWHPRKINSLRERVKI